MVDAGNAGVRRLYRELWRFAEGHRAVLVGAVSLLIGSQVFKLGVPWLSARAINIIQQQGAAGLSSAGVGLVLIVAATAASWLLHGPGRVLERNVALRVRERLNNRLLQHLLSAPLDWHEAHHSGETSHRMRQTCAALYDFAQSQFIYLQNAVRLIGPLIALYLIAHWVGLVAVLGFVAIGAATVGFDRAMMSLATRENDAERRYAAALQDVLGNVLTVYALRQTRRVGELIGRRLHAVFEPLRRAIVVNEAKWCTVDILSQVLSCALVALYAWQLVRAMPSAQSPILVGNLYMVYEYALQAGAVVTAIAAHFQNLARQSADYASGRVILEAPQVQSATGSSGAAPAAPGAAPFSPGDATVPPGAARARALTADWRRLDVAGLDYRHARARDGHNTLHDLAFTLETGRRYALIGASGSGKTSLLRVLAGLDRGDRIAATVDGGRTDRAPADIAALLRGSSTLIPQQTELFEATLEENLALYERLDAQAPSVLAVRGALSLAGADDFIAATPDALRLPVAERGTNWSGGQRQRVALARGILAAQGSALLLLDEPTASLDPAIERQIFENLFSAFPDSAIVVSLHRMDLLDRFDEVWLMRDGRLIERGHVNDLRDRSAAFRELGAASKP